MDFSMNPIPKFDVPSFKGAELKIKKSDQNYLPPIHMAAG